MIKQTTYYTNLDISKYTVVLDKSMKRLNSSSEYAKAVIQFQGIDLYYEYMQQLR